MNYKRMDLEEGLMLQILESFCLFVCLLKKYLCGMIEDYPMLKIAIP